MQFGEEHTAMKKTGQTRVVRQAPLFQLYTEVPW